MFYVFTIYVVSTDPVEDTVMPMVACHRIERTYITTWLGFGSNQWQLFRISRQLPTAQCYHYAGAGS